MQFQKNLKIGVKAQYCTVSEVEVWLDRTRRRERLFACDWVVTRATEAGTPVPAEWVTYRQALRDLPDTVPTSDHRAMCEDRNHASWPTIPS